MKHDVKYVPKGIRWELVEPVTEEVVFESDDFDEFFGFLSENFLEYDHCNVRWESIGSRLGLGKNRMDHWVWNHEKFYPANSK